MIQDIGEFKLCELKELVPVNITVGTARDGGGWVASGDVISLRKGSMWDEAFEVRAADRDELVEYVQRHARRFFDAAIKGIDGLAEPNSDGYSKFYWHHMGL